MTRALFLNGSVGVGKTTVADAIGSCLAAAGDTWAVIDLDWLRNAGPAPADDPFQVRLELANLASVVANFHAAGVRSVVAAGVLENPAERSRYVEALGGELTVVRLVAERELVRARLRARHALDPAGLQWHLARHDELSEILDRAQLDDAVVENAGDPDATARAVLAAAGWLG